MLTKISNYLNKNTLTKTEYNIGSLIMWMLVCIGGLIYILVPVKEPKVVAIVWGMVWFVLVVGTFCYLRYLKRYIVR